MALASPDSDPTNRRTFEAFVPQVLRRRLASGPASQPVIHESDAAVLFVDIAGFTALTERLAEKGVSGAEEVKKILDLCVGPLVEAIAEHGGEVLKFAGDAVLAAWWEEPDEDLPTTVERAAACGLEIQEKLDGLRLTTGDHLKLRVKLGAAPEPQKQPRHIDEHSARQNQHRPQQARGHGAPNSWNRSALMGSVAPGFPDTSCGVVRQWPTYR